MAKKLIYLLVMGSLMAALIASGVSAKSQATLDPGTRFYVPKFNKGATEQIADLTSSGNKADAILIKKMQAIPLPKGSWSKKLLTRETVGTQKCMLGVSSFKPGTVTSLLVHEEEELAYVLAGRGKIRLKERDVPYQSGEGIYIPAGVPHAVVNDGEEEVIMVFTFSYPDYPPTQKIDTEVAGGRP